MRITILGSAQDAGVPQLFCDCTQCSVARADPSHRRRAASIRVDFQGKTWLIDASPDLRSQWRGPPPTGIVLTHAHMGHVAGLALLGKEGSRIGSKLLATPRLIEYLRSTPYARALGTMAVHAVEPGQEFRGGTLDFRFHRINHRDEDADTVAVEISDGRRKVLYLPDTDRWDNRVDAAVAELVDGDTLVFDGTFYDGQEMPDRDMAEIPHPLVSQTLPRLQDVAGRGVQVILTHLNHTNHLCGQEMAAPGVAVAFDGMEF